ncbi:MAG: glycoside hydrolase family 5 [Rhodocyclales bacterium]|nr:glycoside hydrolase family 5 [Rhodocyclales bacterium]
MFSRHGSAPALAALAMSCFIFGGCVTPKPEESFPLYATSAEHVTASAQAFDTARALGRGVNLGNVFESPRGDGDWGVPMLADYVDKISTAGFTTVRIPVRWSNHATTDGAAVIDEAFARRIDETVDAFLVRGMHVVLNVHHYRQLAGDRLDPGEAQVDDAVLRVRFFKLWQQIAARYKDRSPRLIFELLNEPHGPLDADWNDMASRALRIVRQSNPQRVVMIGPGRWNSADALAQLRLPSDPNLIVTVHDYDPFDFTHQGAEWTKPVRATGVSCCSDEQRTRIARGLAIAQTWGQRNGYPLWLGEFGAYSKAAMPSRAAYTRAVRDEAEKRGITWAYWEFGAGFGVYDPRAGNWRPELLEALLGK